MSGHSKWSQIKRQKGVADADNSMPSENIERAIKRGSGEAGAGALTEIKLEGYGPSGLAVLVEALSDNRNRTVQEVRRLFTRHGGNLGESGCVSWLFENRGVITVESNDSPAEEIALRAIDAGAEDVKTEKDYMEIYTQPEDLEKVRKVIEEEEHVISAELSLTPKTTVLLEENKAVQALNFLDELEGLDDVQRVFSNIDFSEATLERLRGQT